MMKWLLLSPALALVFACSSEAHGPKNSDDTRLSNEVQFCGAWASAACDARVVEACGAPSEDACVEAQRSFCEDLVPTGYAGTNAADCIDAVQRAYADAVLERDELDTVLNLGGACAHLVAGSRPEGASCAKATDCDTVHDFECVIKAGDETGTCQLTSVQGPGEPCDEPDQVCAAGTYCDGANCLVTRATGKACDYDAMCDDGNLCEGASDDEHGTCTPKLELSEPCTTNDQCASGICLTTAVNPKCVDHVALTPESSLCVNLGG